MKNPATADRNELNTFTSVVKMFNEFGWGTHGIRLRNGDVVKPVYREADDDLCESSFVTTSPMMYWNLDGTSVSNRNFDMMELV